MWKCVRTMLDLDSMNDYLCFNFFTVLYLGFEKKLTSGIGFHCKAELSDHKSISQYMFAIHVICVVFKN